MYRARTITALFLVAAGGIAPALAAKPPITDLAFAQDGHSVVAVSQSGLQIYSWPELKLKSTIATTADNLHAVEFSPNEKMLAVGGGDPSEEGIVEIFSWPDGKSMHSFADHDDSVTAVVWFDDTQFFSASLDRTIQLQELDRTTPTRTFAGHSRGVSALRLLRDHATLVSASDDQSVRVWDIETGKLARSLTQHTEPIRSLSISPNDEGLPSIATAGEDRTIRFWQPTIGRMVRYVKLDATALDIAWARFGPRDDIHECVFACCDDGRVRIVDPAKVKIIDDLPAINGWAYAIAIHPNDQSFAVGGSDGLIRRVEFAR